MIQKEGYRNVLPFITEPGLHCVQAAQAMREDGTFGHPKRPYYHFLVEDVSNGVSMTRITPVVVEERDGRFLCTPYTLYNHIPPQSYHIGKLTHEIVFPDFNSLPVLLFPGDKLKLVGGLEAVTLSK
jgi:hypothetical protein